MKCLSKFAGRKFISTHDARKASTSIIISDVDTKLNLVLHNISVIRQKYWVQIAYADYLVLLHINFVCAILFKNGNFFPKFCFLKLTSSYLKKGIFPTIKFPFNINITYFKSKCKARIKIFRESSTNTRTNKVDPQFACLQMNSQWSFSLDSPLKARPILLFHILNIYCTAESTSWYLRLVPVFPSRPTISNQPYRKFGKAGARPCGRSCLFLASMYVCVCPLSAVYFQSMEGRAKQDAQLQR